MYSKLNLYRNLFIVIYLKIYEKKGNSSRKIKETRKTLIYFNLNNNLTFIIKENKFFIIIIYFQCLKLFLIFFTKVSANLSSIYIPVASYESSISGQLLISST